MVGTSQARVVPLRLPQVEIPAVYDTGRRRCEAGGRWPMHSFVKGAEGGGAGRSQLPFGPSSVVPGVLPRSRRRLRGSARGEGAPRLASPLQKLVQSPYLEAALSFFFCFFSLMVSFGLLFAFGRS